MGCFVTGIALLALAAYLWQFRNSEPQSADSSAATTSPSLEPSELSIYTSGEYGFSFFYPENAQVTDAYSLGSQLAGSWRLQAVGTGTPLVRITSSNEEARVGVSTDTRERAACLKAGPAEKAESLLTVASTSWSRFSFDKLGTDDERRVDSYRTLRNGYCYAVEVTRPLGRGGAPSATSTAYTIKDILTSFTFAS